MRVSLEFPPITAEEVKASRRLLRTTTAALVLSLVLVGGVAMDVGVPLLLERRAQTRALAACVERALATAHASRRGMVDTAEVHRGVDDTVIVADDAIVLLGIEPAHRCFVR